MIVIPPIKINDARLISSSVPEPYAASAEWAEGTAYAVGNVCYRKTASTWRQYRCVMDVTSTTPPEIDTGHWDDVGPHEVLWDAATNYVIDQQAIRSTTHRRYRCVISGVDAGVPESTPNRWQDIGPTNRWAVHDQGRNLQTVSLEPVTIVIEPGQRINSFALLGVQAKTVTVTMTVGGVTVYTHTKWLSGRNTKTWSQYFFGLFEYLPTLLLTDLPPHAGARITVVLDNGPLPARISALVAGNSVFLGITQYNAKSDSLNFSKIERDEFGNSLLIPRRTVPKTQQSLVLEKQLVNTVRKARADLNAIPALWSWLDDKTEDGYFDAGLVFGIYKQFEIDLAYPNNALINLEVEEL